MTYTPKTFTIPTLVGISESTIAEHIKLYEGYVKHVNLIQTHLAEFKAKGEENIYEIGELNRRFAFEFNGMKNHEYYFEQLEGGVKSLTELSDESNFKKQVIAQWGTIENFLTDIKQAAKTRGIGWAIVWKDRATGDLVLNWIDEQHLGQLNSCDLIFGIDMWEHSYVADYLPSGKGKYIDDYIANVNWEVVEARF